MIKVCYYWRNMAQGPTSTLFLILMQKILRWTWAKVATDVVIAVMAADFFHKFCAFIHICKEKMRDVGKVRWQRYGRWQRKGQRKIDHTWFGHTFILKSTILYYGKYSPKYYLGGTWYLKGFIKSRLMWKSINWLKNAGWRKKGIGLFRKNNNKKDSILGQMPNWL